MGVCVAKARSIFFSVSASVILGEKGSREWHGFAEGWDGVEETTVLAAQAKNGATISNRIAQKTRATTTDVTAMCHRIESSSSSPI
jgi:hypothetical protein